MTVALRWFSLSITLLLITCLPAEAATSCASVDLRAGFGPIRNQTALGLCYAFAAADLVSYKLQQTISAKDISISYIDREKNVRDFNIPSYYTNTGGTLYTALQDLQPTGFCQEADSPSDDSFTVPVNGIDYSQQGLKAALDQLETLKDEQFNASDVCGSIGLIETFFPNTNAQQIFDAVKFSTSAGVLMIALDKATCNGSRLKPTKPLQIRHVANQIKSQVANADKSFTYTYESGKDILVPAINAALDKNLPVGIEYDATENLFTTPDQYKAGTSDGAHESVIVAREPSANGGCEYLIRNSWGRDCEAYDPMYRCDEDPGYVWVPESFLDASLLGSIDYIE